VPVEVYPKLKYVWYWEFDADKTSETIDTYLKMVAAREKGAPDLPKLIYGPFTHVGTSKGFTVFETDDAEKLHYMAMHYLPFLQGDFVPIIENMKSVEIWKKVKK
jgi:hypothetical protein